MPIRNVKDYEFLTVWSFLTFVFEQLTKIGFISICQNLKNNHNSGGIVAVLHQRRARRFLLLDNSDDSFGLRVDISISQWTKLSTEYIMPFFCTKWELPWSKKKSAMAWKKVLFHHCNAPSHTSTIIRFQVVSQRHYSLDLIPSG